MWRQARVCVREVWRAQKQNSPAGRRKAFSQELKHPSTCWQRSRLGPLPVAPWMKMWNFIIEPPDEACEGGKTEKRKRRRRRRRGGQVLTVTGHPIATETWVRGHSVGGAARGRGKGRARAPSSGAAKALAWITRLLSRRFGDAGWEVTYSVALKRTHRLARQQQQGSVCARLVTTAILHLAHKHLCALGEDELGQLGWSNRTARSAAGH